MRKVLIVDDNATNRELLRMVLQKEGCSVDEASNGKEGLEALKTKSYDLVLMDLNMPVMDGCEAIRQIREVLHLEVAIVVVSANLDGQRLQKLQALGIDDYIHKPYNLQTMLKILRGYIQ